MWLDVRETSAARQDRRDIWLYIARDNPVAADAVLDAMQAAAIRLSELPRTGRPRPELGSDVRSIPVGNYVMFYRIDAKAIHVLPVLHVARDLSADLISG